MGVVVGKFLPPHAGHSLLIRTAVEGCTHATVLVCAKVDDLLPAPVRAGMLRELHPEAEVVVTVDDIPEHDPEERAEEISEAWAQRTLELFRARYGRGPDVVFSSEEYGPRYARYLGARHVAVDPDRVRVPISGTVVRSDPFGSWEYLDPCVRAWFVRRVCVVGAESTGTTTLAQDLAAHFGCGWVPEYGREFCEVRLAERPGVAIDWQEEDFVEIATGQQLREDAAARGAARLLVCDTDALATSIWHERYRDRPSERVRALAASRTYDLYLLTGDEIPFVQDGTRDGEHVRGWMTGRFREELARRPEPWLELHGSRSERLAAAVEAVTPLLRSGARPR